MHRCNQSILRLRYHYMCDVFVSCPMDIPPYQVSQHAGKSSAGENRLNLIMPFMHGGNQTTTTSSPSSSLLGSIVTQIHVPYPPTSFHERCPVKDAGRTDRKRLTRDRVVVLELCQRWRSVDWPNCPDVGRGDVHSSVKLSIGRSKFIVVVDRVVAVVVRSAFWREW